MTGPGASSSTTRFTCSRPRSSALRHRSRPCAASASPRPSSGRTAGRATSSPSSAPSVSTCPGRWSKSRAGSPRPPAARYGSPISGKRQASATRRPLRGSVSESPPRTRKNTPIIAGSSTSTGARRCSSSARYLDQVHRIQEKFGAPIITGETPQAERDALCTGNSGMETFPCSSSLRGQLRRRPSRRLRGDPGVRQIRLPPGGGPTARKDPEAQAGRAAGAGSIPSSQGTRKNRTLPSNGSFFSRNRGTSIRSSTRKRSIASNPPDRPARGR